MQTLNWKFLYQSFLSTKFNFICSLILLERRHLMCRTNLQREWVKLSVRWIISFSQSSYYVWSYRLAREKHTRRYVEAKRVENSFYCRKEEKWTSHEHAKDFFIMSNYFQKVHVAGELSNVHFVVWVCNFLSIFFSCFPIFFTSSNISTSTFSSVIVLTFIIFCITIHHITFLCNSLRFLPLSVL